MWLVYYFFATQCLLFQDWEIGGKDASSNLVTWRGWNRQSAVTSRSDKTSTTVLSGVELGMEKISFKQSHWWQLNGHFGALEEQLI